MKKILTFLIAAAMTLSAAAQTTKNEVSVSLQAGESIAFTRTGYYDGYEIFQNTLRVQFGYGQIFGGAGVEFPSGGHGQFEANIRGGYTYRADRFSFDAFAILQHGFGHEDINLTLGGAGILGEVRLNGPVWLFGEFRTMWPFFSRMTGGYYYNRATNAYLTIGIDLKF